VKLRIQVTLTVHEAKRMIAKGVARLPSVEAALKSGKVFLKGGTTVSAVCEELVGKPLRISGRVTPQGTKVSQVSASEFHCALIEGGTLISVDDLLAQTIEGLETEDVAIIGANAIDVYGNAALMYGAPMGGEPGKIISGLLAEICDIIVVAGLEKLVRGSLTDIIRQSGRKSIDVSMGMAVGLTPVAGRIITEQDAIPLLADVTCTVIGKGGVFGAEGATTMVVEGEQEDVEKVFQIISSVKGAGVSGDPESFTECVAPHEKCKLHRACIYKRAKNHGE
jgi:hypothetical protein